MRIFRNMRTKSSEFCVYGHYVRKTCIYVGEGVPGRPFNMVSRNESWKSLIQKNHSRVDIRIFKWFTRSRQARKYEKFLIQKLRPLCNKIHNGWGHSKKFKHRMSRMMLGRKIHSEETKRRISENSKKLHHTYKTKQKISIALLGRTRSEATRKRMSLGCKKHGIGKWRKGTTWSAEVRKRMSVSAKKRWSAERRREVKNG